MTYLRSSLVPRPGYEANLRSCTRGGMVTPGQFVIKATVERADLLVS